MRFLLDTHALLWWLFDDDKLSNAVTETLTNDATEVWVSSISFYEDLIKQGRSGMPPIDASVLERAASGEIFNRLPVTVEHAVFAAQLPGPNFDPFDRFLIAQAKIENLVLVSKDRAFRYYDVRTLWKTKLKS